MAINEDEVRIQGWAGHALAGFGAARARVELALAVASFVTGVVFMITQAVVPLVLALVMACSADLLRIGREHDGDR